MVVFAGACDLIDIILQVPHFNFGTAEVAVTENSATVTMPKPYITISGEEQADVTIYLSYALGENEDANQVEQTKLYDYSVDGENIIFDIKDLAADSDYVAFVWIDGGESGVEASEPIHFRTSEHIPVANITCNGKVKAQGLFASVHLSNVAYKVDGEVSAIFLLTFEYSKDGQKWEKWEYAGNQIKAGAIDIELPFSGCDYLTENCEYRYRATLTPSNVDYQPITSKEFTFTTTYAAITASIAKPKLTYNNDVIEAVVDGVKVYYDGVESQDFKGYIHYRVKGKDEWTTLDVAADNFAITIPSENILSGEIYEVKASIVAGGEQSVVESDTATIYIPLPELPDVPAVPEPPTGGDTSSIEGVWHLTSWRGVEPSFDIYLDITATGGITLYQRIDSHYWEIYQASAEINNGVISGVYTDGEVWSATYGVTVSGNTMTWVNSADADEVSVYTRSELPATMPVIPTRASVVDNRFL